MNWLNVDRICFAQRMAMLTVNRIDAVNYREIIGALQTLRELEDPEILAKLLRELIQRSRPELADCSILGMHFDPSQLAWQIAVEHPSLSPKSPFDELERIPLVPEGTPIPQGANA